MSVLASGRSIAYNKVLDVLVVTCRRSACSFMLPVVFLFMLPVVCSSMLLIDVVLYVVVVVVMSSVLVMT